MGETSEQDRREKVKELVKDARLGYAKAAVTGTAPDPGENETVDL
jgi:hypothetical protein